jgi:hypothetical protein
LIKGDPTLREIRCLLSIQPFLLQMILCLPYFYPTADSIKSRRFQISE